MVDQEILNTVKHYVMLIPEEVGVKKAYLFGSFASGKEREESDIDIAVIVENMTDFFSTQRLLMRLRRNIDLRIEPHPIMEQDFNSSNPFAWEIEKTGIKVYPAS
jgi:uncharacterized protein